MGVTPVPSPPSPFIPEPISWKGDSPSTQRLLSNSSLLGTGRSRSIHLDKPQRQSILHYYKGSRTHHRHKDHLPLDRNLLHLGSHHNRRPCRCSSLCQQRERHSSSTRHFHKGPIPRRKHLSNLERRPHLLGHRSRRQRHYNPLLLVRFGLAISPRILTTDLDTRRAYSDIATACSLSIQTLTPFIDSTILIIIERVALLRLYRRCCAATPSTEYTSQIRCHSPLNSASRAPHRLNHHNRHHCYCKFLPRFGKLHSPH